MVASGRQRNPGIHRSSQRTETQPDRHAVRNTVRPTDKQTERLGSKEKGEKSVAIGRRLFHDSEFVPYKLTPELYRGHEGKKTRRNMRRKSKQIGRRRRSYSRYSREEIE